MSDYLEASEAARADKLTRVNLANLLSRVGYLSPATFHGVPIGPGIPSLGVIKKGPITYGGCFPGPALSLLE